MDKEHMVSEESAYTAIPPQKGEEFLNLYRKVENFTREILQENEKLRYRVAALEQEAKELREHGSEASADQAEVIERLEREKSELLHRYKAVELENVDFAKRYVEIEEENNNLANLYVASYQLHSTLDFREVLQVVKEIIINLIGAEAFAVYMIDQKKGDMTAVVSEGIEMNELPVLRVGEGVVGNSVVQEDGVYVSGDIGTESVNVNKPLVSIPLRLKNDPIGAIVIYRLLQQKKEFTSLDIELFNLLGGHAATAIFGAKLFSESTRKLTTIQGFIELLKPDQGQNP